MFFSVQVNIDAQIEPKDDIQLKSSELICGDTDFGYELDGRIFNSREKSYICENDLNILITIVDRNNQDQPVQGMEFEWSGEIDGSAGNDNQALLLLEHFDNEQGLFSNDKIAKSEVRFKIGDDRHKVVIKVSIKGEMNAQKSPSNQFMYDENILPYSIASINLPIKYIPNGQSDEILVSSSPSKSYYKFDFSIKDVLSGTNGQEHMMQLNKSSFPEDN